MIQNSEWLTRNTMRSYPLVEDLSLISTTTGWTLPNFLLADVSLVVPEADGGLYVSAVTITPMIISVVISSVSTGQAIALARTVQGTSPVYECCAVMPLIPGVGGTITFGSVLEPEPFALIQQARGHHQFSAAALLQARTFMDTGPMPVNSLSANTAPVLQGDIGLLLNGSLVITPSVGMDAAGDPLTILSLSLANPSAFLSPCENSTTVCGCGTLPIQTIAGVPGDTNGNVQIQIVDSSGQVIWDVSSPSVLGFLITRMVASLCRRPVMPDQYGRLPDGAGVYTGDVKPMATYKAPADTTFPNPAL